MTERWLPIENYPDYEISDYSRVRSNRGASPRILKTRRHIKGYSLVRIRNDEGFIDRTVHSLVAEAFIGLCPIGMIVRHKDGDPSNNCLSNLSYGTYSQNLFDRVDHGTFGMKLTVRKVKIIRGLYKIGFKVNRLAEMFSVTRNVIYKVTRRHTWAFVD